MWKCQLHFLEGDIYIKAGCPAPREDLRVAGHSACCVHKQTPDASYLSFALLIAGFANQSFMQA